MKGKFYKTKFAGLIENNLVYIVKKFNINVKDLSGVDKWRLLYYVIDQMKYIFPPSFVNEEKTIKYVEGFNLYLDGVSDNHIQTWLNQVYKKMED